MSTDRLRIDNETRETRWVAVDVGSTFTKLCAVSPSGDLLGNAYVATTHEDVSGGIRQGLALLRDQGSLDGPYRVLASSSANGGLRIFVLGLVKNLSVAAAQSAAFGAGGKVVGALARKISQRDVAMIGAAGADLILLAGGIDGGDEETILHNARVLAAAELSVPIVVAGNQSVAESCEATLRGARLPCRTVRNILPEVDRIDAEEAHIAIREEFLSSMMVAKGLDHVAEAVPLVGSVMPTPAAVLLAGDLLRQASDLSNGASRDLVIVDVGGATTDVYSFADGAPTRPGVVVKGLPEPRAKRTVEGDIGIRENAQSIVDHVGIDRLTSLSAGLDPRLSQVQVTQHLQEVSQSGSAYVPPDQAGLVVDAALARSAVEIAVQRHVGTLREVHHGRTSTFVQRGKDLTLVPLVLGVGGILANGPYASFILDGLTHEGFEDGPRFLNPTDPRFVVDHQYLTYAVGLIATQNPSAATRLASEIGASITAQSN